MTRRGRAIILCTAAAACLTFVILKASSGRDDDSAGAPKERKEAVLNEYLTNALSDSIGTDAIDRRVASFMGEWQVKGASLAVMRHDSLLYAKGYGWADEAEGKRMEPYNLLRLASVSKLVTAIGIMKLKEQGKLSLSDHVFGEGGILSGMEYASAIRDRNYYKITVEDLLRHRGGFTLAGGDPMFSTITVMARNGLSTPPDNDKLIECTLKRSLSYMPGTSQAYSNFGYLLLSKVIETLSGESYEDYIQRNVLKPAGCLDFHIAGNYYKDKYPSEVRYYVPVNEMPVEEYSNSGRMVTRCYGGNDIHNLSGAGAWVASVPEIMKLVASVDGKPEIPDILSAESVGEMVRYVDNVTFSLGWNDTNPESGWTRSGSFSGTSAMVKYFPDGECWIMVTNTSTWKGAGFSKKMAVLFSELRQKYDSTLPRRDLFHI